MLTRFKWTSLNELGKQSYKSSLNELENKVNKASLNELGKQS